MGEGNGLAVVRDAGGSGLAMGAKINGMAEVFRLADQLAKARGFVPDAFAGNPAAIAAVILTGMELGIGPMQSMREIHVIKGKPSISATLMLSLARRAGIRTSFPVTDATKATIEVTVPGQPAQRLTFSAEDAKAAGLWGQGNWKTYPAAMLRARAISAAIRAFCPEAIGGSVYESDSGELTNGVPSADVIDVASEPAAPVRAPTRVKLSDVASAEALRDWCAEHGAKALAAGKGDAVLDHAGSLEVPLADVRSWLGIVEVAS